MIKIRFAPETNSSSSHNLVLPPHTNAEVFSDQIFGYIHTYMEELMNENILKEYEKLSGVTGGLDITNIDHDTATTVKNMNMKVDEFYRAVARLYYEVGKIIRKYDWGIEMNFDESAEQDIVYPLDVLFSGGKVYLWKNGTYYIAVLDGKYYTRIKFGDKFEPEYPESIDAKITNKCFAMCPFCHENSTPDGEHGDYENIRAFIDAIAGKVAEVTFGGGNPLLYDKIEDVAKYSMERGVIPSITARDVDYYEYGVPKHFVGYGISLTSPWALAKLINEIDSDAANYVLHVINGVHSTKLIDQALTMLEEVTETPVMLILGFKQWGRGANWKIKNTVDVEALRKKHPNTIFSFDELAIRQLNVDKMIPKYEWEMYYQGLDSDYTMYVDLVKMEYAPASYSPKRYKITDWDIKKMFEKTRE